MATSAQSGNYKVGSTWVGGVVPPDGEAKIIAAGHSVTIDSAVESAAISGGGTLLLNSALTMTGDLTVGDNVAGGLSFGPGSDLNIGANNLNLNCAKLRSTATANNWAKIRGTGNIQNGTAGVYPAYNKQDIELPYVSIQVTGSVLLNVGSTLGSQTARIDLTNAVISGSSSVNIGTTFTPRATPMKISDATFHNAGDVNIKMTSTDSPALNAEIKRCVFSSESVVKALTLYGFQGVIPEDIVFDGYKLAESQYAPFGGVKDTLHILPSFATGGGQLGANAEGLPYVDGSYFYGAAVNSHAIVLTGGSNTQSVDVRNVVFDMESFDSDNVVTNVQGVHLHNFLALGNAKGVSIAATAAYGDVIIEKGTLQGTPEGVTALLFAHGQATGRFVVRDMCYKGADAPLVAVNENYPHTVEYSGHNNLFGVTTAYDPVNLTVTSGTATDLNPAVDPQYVDDSRNFKAYYTHKTGLAWDETLARAAWRKSKGYDPTTKTVTSTVSGFSLAEMKNWVENGFVPTNIALSTSGHDGAQIGAFPVVTAAPAAASVWIDDLTTKYRQGGEDGTSGPATLELHGCKNHIESFQVLVYSEDGLTDVDVTISAVTGPSGSTIIDIYKYLQWYHDCTTHVSRVEYEFGMYPDALIPDVDRYYGEKRNAFPFTVAAGKVQGVLFELGTVTGQTPGTYTATVTVKSGSTTIGTCNLSFVVHDVALPSTSTFPVDTVSFSPHLGYGLTSMLNNAYSTELMIAMVKCAIYHRIGINFSGWPVGAYATDQWTWNNNSHQLTVNSWLPHDAWMIPMGDGTLIADGPYAGAKMGAYRTYKSWPADNKNSVVPMEYRSLATRQYFAQMWNHLIEIGTEPEKYLFIDRFFDEPADDKMTYENFRGTSKVSSLLANMVTVQDAAVLNFGTYRNTFLTSSRKAGVDNFDDYGFFCRGINAPACPAYTHTCQWGENATLQTRDKDRADRHYWLYITCMTSACGQVGSALLSGQLDICVDADALYNSFHGPIWYLYKATGSLHWNVTSYIDSNYQPFISTWRNYWDGFNHGDGFFFYPGVASGVGRQLLAGTPVIGGTHDTVLSCLRLITVFRDSIAFWELCKIAEAKHGRDAVLAVVNTLFANVPLEQKYWNLHLDPDYYRAAKQGVLELAASAVSIPAPVISALSTPSVTGTTTATATLSTTVSGGNLRYVVTANAAETNSTILAGTAHPVVASGLQTVNMTGITPGSTVCMHVIHDGLGGPSNALHSSEFSTPPVTIPNNAPTGTAIIAGEATVGHTLIASNNIFDADGVGTISYAWKIDGISVGSGQAYLILPSNVGKYITVTASYIDGYGSLESLTSSPVGPIAPFQSIQEYEQDRTATIVIPCSILCNEETGEPLGFIGADGREYPSVFGRSFGKSGHISVTHIDMSPLPGDCTINAVSGAASFAQGTSSVTVTCDMCGNGSIVIPVLVSNDATLKTLSVETRDGSFVITGNAPAAAVAKFKFFIVN